MKKTLLIIIAFMVCVQSAGAAYAQQAMLKQLTTLEPVSMPCHQTRDSEKQLNGQCCQDNCQCNHGSANLALHLNLPPAQAQTHDYLAGQVLPPLSAIAPFFRPPIFA